MKFAKNLLKILTVLLVSPVFSAPWNGGIELGTSVANAYGSRSLFTNPAAIAFEKELNGSGLLTSFTYGSTYNSQSEFSLASSYNFIGVGYEKLYQEGDSYSRYQLGLSYALSPEIFWGTRLTATTSIVSSLSGKLSWDFGVQYRPFRYLSVGALATELNQPNLGGIKSPINYTFGVVIRPLNWITLTTDLETPSNEFFKRVGYQTTLALEPIPGLTLSSGYQKEQRLQFGFQFDLIKASIFSVVHTTPKNKISNNGTNYTIGFQTSVKPISTYWSRAKELRIELDESLTEEGREGSFFSKGKSSLTEILDSLKNASESSEIQKINIHLKSFPLGLAAAEEFAEALLKARNRGKAIDVFLTSAKTKEYLIASAATQIYLEPSGDIALLGPRIGHYFAKGTLDKIGVEGEFIARGDYKSAPETFTRRDSSPKSKEATQHELKQLEEALLNILQRTRNVSKSQWQNWLKYAVFSSQDALREKIIDKIGSFSEAQSKEDPKPFITPSTSFASKSLNLPSRIAVIVADGSIMEKQNRLLSATGQSQITPSKVEPLFKRAINDARTKVIVLRVSSPGGEVLASEQIASLIAEARLKKPIFVSMGDVAASGGYFISAPAQTIFADKLTLTGSIGVFLGKFNLGKLYSKLDLKKEISGLSPYLGIDSEHRAWTGEERSIMQRRLNQFYENFVDFVAKNRKITRESAEKAAQGRVWLGRESIDLKIVDSQGGIMDTIEAAKIQTGLNSDTVTFLIREPVGIFDAISEETSPFASAGIESFGFLLDPQLQQEMAKLFWIQKHSVMYLAPKFQILN